MNSGRLTFMISWLENRSYCWWLKSQTTAIETRVNNGIDYISLNWWVYRISGCHQQLSYTFSKNGCWKLTPKTLLTSFREGKPAKPFFLRTFVHGVVGSHELNRIKITLGYFHHISWSCEENLTISVSNKTLVKMSFLIFYLKKCPFLKAVWNWCVSSKVSFHFNSTLDCSSLKKTSVIHVLIVVQGGPLQVMNGVK